ncbi:sperm-tail PG-rich repeat-containing protein 2 [Castor canadensis]|uniref:Sperm-tail PG-rich repeat-containing protein 2 n=1 Tax=Castor canadensis TaxID=51338 RepID=A0AC58JX51_CASCN
MYDRAPRTLRLAEGCGTAERVGPGSYQVPLQKQRVAGGYAPFLSLAARESSFTVAANTAKAGPGPGHYNISKAKKALRAPTVTRSVDVPSIPSCGQAHGYHINDDDSIIKRSPPAIDNTLGPAYYRPQFDASSATLKYKGIHFANSSGRRELLTQPSPGPGQYDIVQKKTLHCENVNIKKDKQQNYCSFLPRFYEVIVLQEEKRRFVPIKSITPAPGTYNEIQTALQSSKKTSSLKNTPFGQSAARFTQDSRAEEIPGPGFYNVLNHTILSNVRNIYLKNEPTSAFGSSVPRISFFLQKDYVSPGPSDYQDFWNSQVVPVLDELPNLNNNYAAFLSRTERTVKAPDKVFPSPGTYDVQKSYEMSQIKHKYMPPRSSVAARKHASFLSATPRCWDKTTDGPGPGEYNPVLRKSCPITSFVRTSKRFEVSKDVSPGPARYELSPFFKHSILKRTFNVTLPNSSLTQRKYTSTTKQKGKQTQKAT